MRLIDADKAVEYMNQVETDSPFDDKEDILEKCVHILDLCPTIDAVSVLHGQWIDKPTGSYGRWQSWCSVCGKHSGIGGIESNRHKPYCPNCGNPMDGGT